LIIITFSNSLFIFRNISVVVILSAKTPLRERGFSVQGEFLVTLVGTTELCPNMD